MKKFILIVTLCSLVGVVCAAPDWNEPYEGGGNKLWSDGTNWDGGEAPGENEADNNPAIQNTFYAPIVADDTGYMWIVTMGVYGTPPEAPLQFVNGSFMQYYQCWMNGRIDFDGGQISGDQFRVGHNKPCLLNMRGGTLSAKHLILGHEGNLPYETGVGVVNLSGGQLIVDEQLTMNTSPDLSDPNFIDGTSVIDISSWGQLIVKPNPNDAGLDEQEEVMALINAYVSIDWIIGNGSPEDSQLVVEYYNYSEGDPNAVSVTAVEVPNCETFVEHDSNGDCAVDMLDFADFAGEWLVGTP